MYCALFDDYKKKKKTSKKNSNRIIYLIITVITVHLVRFRENNLSMILNLKYFPSHFLPITN